MSSNDTADDPPPDYDKPRRKPGLVLVWTNGRPTCRRYVFTRRPFEIGRDDRCDISLPWDDAVSRRHAEVTFDGRDVRVRDVGSSNGTFVDSNRLGETETVSMPAVLRLGGSVFLVDPDTDRLDERDDLTTNGSVVGPVIKRLWAKAEDAANRGKFLLIHGETGTGKERVAKAFHSGGPRARGPFQAINCAHLARDRAEGELFGWARGGFTGADRSHAGVFERADGGVLFLDEIAELPLDVQPKFLRVLEDGVIQPLGGEPKRVDVAVCCASHQDLHALVDAGEFRKDLLRRLMHREIDLPPLRERREEVAFFVSLFHAKVSGAPPVTARFIEACLQYDWPGNIRDLEIAVERAAADAAFDGAAKIEPNPNGFFPRRSIAPPAAVAAPAADVRTPAEMRDDDVAEVVEHHRGNVAAAAKQLGMAASSVYAVLRRVRARRSRGA